MLQPVDGTMPRTLLTVSCLCPNNTGMLVPFVRILASAPSKAWGANRSRCRSGRKWETTASNSPRTSAVTSAATSAVAADLMHSAYAVCSVCSWCSGSSWTRWRARLTTCAWRDGRLVALLSTASKRSWAASSIPAVAAMLSVPSGSSARAVWWAGGAVRRSVAVSGLRDAAGRGSWRGLLRRGGLLLREGFAHDHANLGAGAPVVLGGEGVDLLVQIDRHPQRHRAELGGVAHPCIVNPYKR